MLADIKVIRGHSNAYLFVFRPDLLIEKLIVRTNNNNRLGRREYRQLLALGRRARTAVKSYSIGSLFKIRIALLIEFSLLLIALSLYKMELRYKKMELQFGVVFEIISALWTSRKTIGRRLTQVVRGDRVAVARVVWRLRQFGCLLAGRQLFHPQPQEQSDAQRST